jgi:PhzF family phenazine biosynthesis protein
MRIPFYQVDAFTDVPFRGNPAAVCLLPAELDERSMQNIAAENNLAETAFLVGGNGAYRLRWFAPEQEIDLCGHATLAAAYVLFQFIEPQAPRLTFHTLSGTLSVVRAGDRLTMDFPARPPVPTIEPPMLEEAIPWRPLEVLQSRDLMLVYDSEEAIHQILPDMTLLKEIPEAHGVIITAPGNAVDFVSRYFAPKAGIPEDPVTGSAHCTLVPYWAKRLRKKNLHARQVSFRGGELWCEDRGDRVTLSGQAVLFAKGEILLPD